MNYINEFYIYLYSSFQSENISQIISITPLFKVFLSGPKLFKVEFWLLWYSDIPVAFYLGIYHSTIHWIATWLVTFTHDSIYKSWKKSF